MSENLKGAVLVNSIKEFSGSHGPQFVLRVGRPPIAFLRSVATKKELQNINDISLLSKWRNMYPSSFLTEFNASASQTSNWLSNILFAHSVACAMETSHTPDRQTNNMMYFNAMNLTVAVSSFDVKTPSPSRFTCTT